MGNYGNLFGWLIVTGLVLTLLNYPVKAIYRKWVAELDNESSFKRGYLKFQQFIVKYHRFFGLFTTMMLLTHLIIQISYRWVSRTGIIAASLLVLNVILGAYGHYIRKKKRSAWFYVHRTIAVLTTIAIVLHIVMQGR
ncbi:MAG: hypothetical protein PHR78_01010 [Eubacteriales bacterium]|nr:hypothetical protein [Eubacteriales bacterium]MDD4540737.1 hypothetical protein [Eubacteriales bacterium]